MEKDSTPKQRGKGYLKKSTPPTDISDSTKNVVFYEKGIVSITAKENADILKVFNTLKSTLHAESAVNNLCDWQLPPNPKKASCVPVNCIDSDID